MINYFYLIVYPSNYFINPYLVVTEVSSPSNAGGAVAGVVATLLLVGAGIVGFVFYRRKQKSKPDYKAKAPFRPESLKATPPEVIHFGIE